MNWREQAICQGKTGFPNFTLAARQVKRKGYRIDQREDGVLRPYRCPCCRKWHVGSASDMDEMRKYGRGKR